jgi:hypothetical protein
MPTSPKLLGTEVNVPGGVFIEPHERAGLPIRRLDDKVERDFSDGEVRIAHVVSCRANFNNPFSKYFYRRPSHSTHIRRNNNADAEDPVTYTTSPMTRPSGGILAALLTLYDQKFYTPSVSDTSALTFPENRPGVSPTHSLLELASASGKRIANVSKALHLPEPRPRRERNAAGVWGPLIASTTGALVGAAAPIHSTIAPDIKRPGYHLSRFVHDFCSVALNLLITSRSYSMDNSVPTVSTHPPLKRPQGMLFEGSTDMQRHSITSSPSQTPAHIGPHAPLFASDSKASCERFATGTEDLHDLPKHGWISDQGAFLGTPNTAIDSAWFNEKGYWSTDTENNGRRDATTWRREKKRRRRKAEIYVSFFFHINGAALVQLPFRSLGIYHL